MGFPYLPQEGAEGMAMPAMPCSARPALPGPSGQAGGRDTRKNSTKRKEAQHMGLDERALGSTAATIAYGLTGVLSLIPAIQEISLDRNGN